MKDANFHSKNYYWKIYNNFKLFLNLKLVSKLISSCKHLNYLLFESMNWDLNPIQLYRFILYKHLKLSHEKNLI